MAHWAEINSNNKVLQVLVGDNNEPDEGLSWLNENLGGTWIKTSYNAKIRGKFAGVGDIYDETADRFIAAQPYPSWKLDKEFNWQSPTAYPSNGKDYKWNESSKSWDEIIPTPAE